VREWVIPFLAAMGTGILSAWGVGGGTLLLVCMTLFLGVEPPVARAINLLFFLPAAAVGLFFHGKNGYLDKAVWRQAALPGAVVSFLAAAVTAGMDASALRRPFGLLLLFGAAGMLKKRKP